MMFFHLWSFKDLKKKKTKKKANTKSIKAPNNISITKLRQSKLFKLHNLTGNKRSAYLDPKILMLIILLLVSPVPTLQTLGKLVNINNILNVNN